MKYLPLLQLKYEAQLRKHSHFSQGRNCTMLSGNRETFSVRKMSEAQPWKKVLTQKVCATEILCNSVAESRRTFRVDCDS